MHTAHFAFRAEKDQFVGGDAGYRVEARGNTVAFAARDTSTLELETLSIAGSHSAATSARVLDDGSLWRDVGGVHERLINDEVGVEQSWTFDSKPAGSDLVVEIAARGLAYAGATDGGLHFRDTRSGGFVRYGAATFVDADGRRTKAESTFVKGKIVLRVPADVISTARFPAVLDPIVSAESAVDGPRPRLTQSARSPRVVAGPSGQFLVTWFDTLFYSHTALLAARVKADGTILDPMGTVVAEDVATASDVAFDGTNYFAVWRASLGSSVYGRSIRALDGTLVEPTPTSFKVASAAPTDISVAWSGTQFLVAYSTSSSVAAQRVQSGAAIGAPVSLATTGSVSGASVASDGSDFFVTYGGKFGRRVKADGTLMDAAPIQFAGLSAGPTARVAYDGAANYYAVWVYIDRVWGARIRAADGVVLDADDTFSGISGSRVIAMNTTGPSSHRYAAQVRYDGAKLIAGWLTDSGGFYAYGAVIDPSTGDPLSTGYIGHPRPDGYKPSFEMAWGSSGGLLVWGQHDDDVFLGTGAEAGIWASPATRTADTVSADGTVMPFRLSRANDEQYPTAVSNGTDFLVAWADRSTPDTTISVYAARIRGTDGTVLDPTAIKLSGALPYYYAGPVAASDGTDYLVAWDKAYLRVRSADGSLDGAPRALAGTPTSVAASRRNYLVTWTGAYAVQAARIDLVTGALVDTTPISLSSSGGRASVAGNTPADIDRGSFLVVWTQGSSSSYSVSMQIVRDKAGTTPIPKSNLASGSTSMPAAVASDGEDFAVVWAGKGTRVASLDMSVLDKTGTAPGVPVMSFTGTPILFRRGAGYLLAYRDTKVHAGRLDAMLSPLDGPTGVDLTGTIEAASDSLAIAGAASSAGRSLIAYARYDRAISAASRLEYRFLDDGPASVDAGPDAADTAVDATYEAALDTGEEAALDAPDEAASDAADEAATDAVAMEIGPDVGADTGAIDAADVSTGEAGDSMAAEDAIADAESDSFAETAVADAEPDGDLADSAEVDAAGAATPSAEESSGCGCRSAGGGESSGLGSFALAIAAALGIRRRTASASQRSSVR